MDDRRPISVTEGDVLERHQWLSTIGLDHGLERGRRVVDSALNHDRGGHFHLPVVHHLSQAIGRATVRDVALLHKEHPIGTDAQRVLDAVLDEDDADPLVGQATEKGQSFLGACRVEAGQRFVEQQDAGAHRQHASEGNFLLFAAREVERLPVAQVRDVQVVEGFIHPLDDLLARQPQVLQSESDLVEHIAAQDLPLWILEDGPDGLGDLSHRHLAGILPVEESPSLQISVIGTGNEAVDAANECRLAAAAGTSDEE